jgi:prevent-host-death family protein
MKIASVAEVKAQLSAFLKLSESGPVVVTRNGRAVAVLIGIQDEDEIERLLMAYSPQLRAILEKSRQQIREGQCLSHEEFWAQFKVPHPAKKEPRKSGKGLKAHA